MADAPTIFNACREAITCPGSDYPVSNFSSEANDGPEFIFMRWPGNGGGISGSGGGGVPFCPPGSTLFDGQCWTQVPGVCSDGSDSVNGLCLVPSPTCPPGSTAINGQCWIPCGTPVGGVCPVGCVEINGQCWQQVCPDGSTLIDGQCWIPGTGVCPPGSVEINGQCWMPGNPCPPGSTGIGISYISEIDAMLCAALWSETCGNMSTFAFCTPSIWQYGNGGTPGVGDGLFFNDAQSCTVACANGSQFTYTIAAGKVANASQDMANSIAKSLVCQFAESQKVCLVKAATPQNPGYNPLNLIGGSGFCCTGQSLSTDPIFEVTGSGEWTFSVSSGSLPTGTGLLQYEPTTCALAGTLDVPGIYTFTIQAANTGGQSVSQTFTIHLIGLQSPSLPNGSVGTDYSGQVVALGVALPVTIVPLGPLPPGLSMDSSGNLTGTPTTPGTY